MNRRIINIIEIAFKVIGLIVLLSWLIFNPPQAIINAGHFFSTFFAVDNEENSKEENIGRAVNKSLVDEEDINLESNYKAKCDTNFEYMNGDQDRYLISNRVKVIIDNVIASGVEPKALDRISYETGIPIYLTRKLLILSEGHPYINKYPNDIIPVFETPNWISSVNKTSLKLSMKINDYSLDEIIGIIKDDKVKNSAIYTAGPYKLPLLSFLHYQSDLFNEESARLLIDAGYAPTMSDLAYFTSKNFDLDFIKYIYSKNESDVTSIHRYPPFFKSLSSIALESGNTDAVFFWHELGSIINPDPLGNSAISILRNAEKQGLYSELELRNIVNIIIDEPLSNSDIDTLFKSYSRFLDEDVIKNKDFTLHSVENESQLNFVNKVISDIESTVLHQINLNESQKPCSRSIVKNVLSDVFNTLLVRQYNDKSKQENAIKGPIVSPEKSEYFEKLVEQKKAHESLLKDEMSSKSHKMQDNFQIQKSTGELKNELEIIKLLKNGQWQLAQQLLAATSASEKDALNALVAISISINVSDDIIFNLLEHGGQLPDSGYLLLLSRRKYALIEKLIPFGLNINKPALEGGDVLKDVVSYGTAKEVGLFLKNGAIPDTHIEGMDALDTVLARFSLSGDDATVVQKLLDSGIRIEDSHLAFTYKIFQRSPAAYRLIREEFSELTIFDSQIYD